MGKTGWPAAVVGCWSFGGVLLIIRPGATTFNLGSVFVLISVFFYAVVHGGAALADHGRQRHHGYYSSLVYLACC
ncbi:MAG: hypothetical protein R2851_03915 [Caldilineaceae bacterium]